MRASVVIAAFDAESTLGEQLEALSSQRVEGRWEVLVCDNGSRDGTVEVARSFAGRLPVRVIDASARRGPAAARNIGAQHAEGEALLFCDADDIVADGWVTALLAALDHAGAVGGRLEWARLNTHYADRGALTPALFTFDSMPGMPAASSNNLGVRSTAFARVGGFEEALRVGEDVDLCWRLQLDGCALVAADDAVVHARERTTLRAVWRQAKQYGEAERRLAVRFDPVRRAFDADRAPDPVRSARDDRRPRRGALRSVARRAARVRRPHDLVYTVRRSGRAYGFRFARIDPDLPLVQPPYGLSTARQR